MRLINFRDHINYYRVWVLAPYIETQDPNLKYYYDYTQSIAEYKKVFEELSCEWQWVNVTLSSFAEAIRGIKNYPSEKVNIVVNLCDGDEVNGLPGLSVIHCLEEHGIIYTGSNDFFYRITTSKIPMKEAFDRANVATPAWKVIDPSHDDSTNLFKEIGDTLIVKPAVSAGSLGLGIKNVVTGASEYSAIVQEMQQGYRGWKLDTGGIFVEEYITGREFTTLVVGSATHPDGIGFYPPAERVFHPSLPDTEKFLSFDRLWETYDLENPLRDNGHLYDYREPEQDVVPALREISMNAFMAVGGTGYGRLDIRMDSQTGRLYVLEVNAQCGLSEDENFTSIGAILRFAKKSFTYLIIEIIEDGIMRYGATHNA